MGIIMKLPLGKVPISVLRNILGYVRSDKTVLEAPGVGIDAAVISLRDNIIVSACDPITGASKDIGWLSVHVNANDIAVCAAYPRWYVVTLLFPPKTTEDDIYEVMGGIKKALEEVDANLVSGHTEITNKVSDVIVIGTMIGAPMIKGKYVSNRNAKVGDYILMTKGAGIEGTWILAEAFRSKLEIDRMLMEKIMRLKKKISVLPDVEAVVKIGVENIHAMHDATEGGVLGALYELAEASRVGFEVYQENMIILDETRKISEYLSIDPLKLISSGTLIVVVDKDMCDQVVENLKKKQIDVSIIGKITDSKRVLIKENGEKTYIDEPPIDELWRILEGGYE